MTTAGPRAVLAALNAPTSHKPPIPLLLDYAGSRRWWPEHDPDPLRKPDPHAMALRAKLDACEPAKGDMYARMPGLCDHGLKTGLCGSCRVEDT